MALTHTSRGLAGDHRQIAGYASMQPAALGRRPLCCSTLLPEASRRRQGAATCQRSAAGAAGAGAAPGALHAEAAAAAAAFREFERAGWSDPTLVGHYGSLGMLTSQAAPALLAAVAAGPGTRLLDIACGPGYVTGAAAQLGCEATGIDFSPAMVEQARASYPAVTFREGSAEALDMGPGMFDAVTINFGLLHIAQPDTALQEALRVLKPGGRIAFTVWQDPKAPGADALRILMGSLHTHGNMALPLPPGPSLFRFADAAESLHSVGAAGFTDIEVKTVMLKWRLQHPDAMIAAFREGGVRIGALLRGQTRDASDAIHKAVAEGLAPFQQQDGSFLVQSPCVLTSATKPLL